jgi:uncharacterized protein YjbJ (UPF0337 family)
MNRDRIEGNGKRFEGNVEEQWAKLTSRRLDAIAGNGDAPAGRIQETFGITKETTGKRISAWPDRVKEKEER